MGNPNGYVSSVAKFIDKKLSEKEGSKTSLELLYTQPACELGKPGIPEIDPVSQLVKADGSPLAPSTKRRVAVMKDHTLEYPELFLEVFIAGDKWEEAAFAPMFTRSRCQRAARPEDADIVVFTGGQDVEPALYGEKAHKLSHWSQARDTRDIALYAKCLQAGIPMFGVCRGAQFLHVMNGGKLYQHVDNHNGDHMLYDVRTKKIIDKVSSVHHQMCIPSKDNGFQLVATCPGKSNQRYIDPERSEVGKHPDCEAFFYRDTCCIGVQGHPEYANYNYYTKWCLELINSYVIENPDINWDQTPGRAQPNRRMDPSLINERAALGRLKPVVVLSGAEEEKKEAN